MDKEVFFFYHHSSYLEMESISLKPKVVIVGAGLTGLTLAWRLAEANIPFLLLEKKDRLGGQIHTQREKGYTFEIGPNTGTISFPEVALFFEELYPLATLETAHRNAYTRLIAKHSKLYPLPSGLGSGITTSLFTFKDKLNILWEPFRKKGQDPLESVGSLAERRLGKSIVQYAVDPFVGGIYASDPYFLTAQYALPKLYKLEQQYGSFIRGAIVKAKKRKTIEQKKVTKEVFSAIGGLQNIIEALYQKISQKGEIKLSTNIRHVCYNESDQWTISFQTQGGEVEEIKTPYYITTVRGDELPSVVPKEIGSQIDPIKQIPYAPIWEIAVGFDHYQGDQRKAFGALVPSCERKNILGILFPSDCFQGRVPYSDSRLFTLFMGGLRDGDKLKGLTDETIINIGIKELYTLLRIPNSLSPDLVHLSYFPKAIPQYGIDSPARLHCIQAVEEKYKGLILAGGIKDGIGMAHRIKQAFDIAKKIVPILSREV